MRVVIALWEGAILRVDMGHSVVISEEFVALLCKCVRQLSYCFGWQVGSPRHQCIRWSLQCVPKKVSPLNILQ